MRAGNLTQGECRAAYGEVSAKCARCGSKVIVRVETDGDGALVDLVEPCASCLPRPSAIRVHGLRGAPRERPDAEAARAEVERLLGARAPVKEIAARVGLSASTVRVIRRQMGTLPCGCGRPGTHPGRCGWRRAQGGNAA